MQTTHSRPPVSEPDVLPVLAEFAALSTAEVSDVLDYLGLPGSALRQTTQSTPVALMRSAHPVLNRTSARLDDSRRSKQVSGCWFNQFRHRFAKSFANQRGDNARYPGIAQQ